MGFRTLIPAADVIALRHALRLKQADLAKRLGVTRRTVIRGEQRGLEIPSRHGDSPRKAVGEAWHRLKQEARDVDRARLEKANLEARRRSNRAAARRYRAKRKVTNKRRSRVTKKARRRQKVTPARSAKPRPRASRRDTSRKIPRKKSPARAAAKRKNHRAGRRRELAAAVNRRVRK